MSRYTIETRFICESICGLDESMGFSNVQDILEQAAPKIFDFDYPIFDENYRLPLEIKILRHYYTREICCETVGLWKLRLQQRLNEIMPYYNQLYKSALLEFDPLADVDLWTTHTGDNNGTRDTKFNEQQTGEARQNSSDDNWREYSDTPQGGLQGIASHEYLTNATHNTDEASQTLNSTNNKNNTGNEIRHDTEKYLTHIAGRNGHVTGSKLLQEFRETFLNIDAMVLKDMSPLFFGLLQ